MRRQRRVKDAEPLRIVAYDYETTRIAVGTPQPLYITAYGTAPKMHYESSIDSMLHLRKILENNFLTEENEGVAFVAWNGNNFDAYFTAAALVTSHEWVMRPFLTQSKSLRGLRVIRRADIENPKARGWLFLDGIAMLGLIGTKLSKLLATFAPHLPKLTEAIDFEKEEFDSGKAKHREYAMRDSVGLEFAMRRAQGILIDKFNQPLAVTMGGACIRILKSHMPEDAVVTPLDENVNRIIRDYVMRGGFCYCVRRYDGPVWKYDLNQAYAAAMREAWLPSSFAQHSLGNAVNRFARCYVARIEAWKPGNKIPFFYRAMVGGRMRAYFDHEHISETWLTSIEIAQLRLEGWRIEIRESWAWGDAFRLKEYVDKLETLRMNCEGGPKGDEGTIYKCVGNHSYGKTLEQIEPIEHILAAECPEGYVPTYSDDDTDPLQFVFERRIDDMLPKDYHQPHLGAFITAHVRMVVRRAALLAPDAWLYADTDCVVFSSEPQGLDIHPSRYGAWKVEEEGTRYQIIAKKVYASTEGSDDPEKWKRSAKGMHIRQITPLQFTGWLGGSPPVQEQVQRNNFLRVMEGAEMYRFQRRTGTAVKASE